ncbi:MAG: leucyl aminopeptidase, partial [Gammaproteobacteria bacterium]|nr:leucyl aminopeptidase [Gammaproteobacteria bacterium]
MDFQLKTLPIAQAAAEKADALVVLVTDARAAAKDPISTLLSESRKSGELSDKAGKILTTYRPTGIAARRVVLASVGDGKPASIRSAVLAGMQAIKSADPKRVAVVFADAV